MRRRVRRSLYRVAAVALIGPLATTQLAILPAQPARASTSFTVFDNTDYENVSITGASEATFIPNRLCQEMYDNGQENNEAYWKNLVSTWITSTSSLGVLDCEDLYLNSSGSAQYNYGEMLRLQGWAREVYPNMRLGWYGLIAHTDPGLRSYYEDLLNADGNQAFLPSLYNFGGSQQTWAQKAQDALSEADAIDSSLPLYAYVWPQYHKSASPASIQLDWVDPGRWSYQLATLADGGFDGAVVWGGLPLSTTCDSTCQSEAASQGWLTKTTGFILWAQKSLTDVALNKSASASSTNYNRLPEYAIDGDPYTKWNSEVDDPEYITIDLGAIYSIDNGVRTVWTGAYSTSYTIEFSTNGTSWNVVYSTSSGSQGQRYHPTATGSARYVRITGTARSNPSWGHALWSVNVYD